MCRGARGPLRRLCARTSTAGPPIVPTRPELASPLSAFGSPSNREVRAVIPGGGRGERPWLCFSCPPDADAGSGEVFLEVREGSVPGEFGGGFVVARG